MTLKLEQINRPNSNCRLVVIVVVVFKKDPLVVWRVDWPGLDLVDQVEGRFFLRSRHHSFKSN